MALFRLKSAFGQKEACKRTGACVNISLLISCASWDVSERCVLGKENTQTLWNLRNEWQGVRWRGPAPRLPLTCAPITPAVAVRPPSILSSAEVSRSSYLQVYCPWSSARTSAMVSLWTLCSTSVLCLPWGLRILPFLNHSDFTFGTENWHVMVQVWPSFKVTSWRCRSQAGSAGMTHKTFCLLSHADGLNGKWTSQGVVVLIKCFLLTNYG